MTKCKKYLAESEIQTCALGASLAKICPWDSVIYLYGELGSGKTTLVRSFLQQLGVRTKIKSPTYTIVEPYTVDDLTIYHFDLYRIYDSAELEYLGVRDYLNSNYIFLVEWPEVGIGILPIPDLEIHIAYLEDERDFEFRSHTEKGNLILKSMTHQ